MAARWQWGLPASKNAEWHNAWILDKVLIIDAKYYKNTLQNYYDVNTVHSGNLYQIFTYVKNKQIEVPDSEVSGMLLYARTDEELLPNNTYKMSGNSISVKTLDLNQDFWID